MKVQRAATENKSHGLQAAWPNTRRDGRRDGVREWWGGGSEGGGNKKKKKRQSSRKERDVQRAGVSENASVTKAPANIR